MKKKIIIVAVVIVALVLIIAFAGNDNKPNEDKDDISIGELLETTGKSEEKETKPEETTKPQKKDPDKMVTMRIPLAYIDEEYQNNLDGYAERYGYKSAKKNSDGTVTIKMKSLSRDLYVAKMGINTMRAICETFESKEYPYVKNLGEYERDFSYVTLLVDGKKFKKSDNSEKLFNHVALCCAFYLALKEDAPDTFKIDICSEKTGKLLAEKTYNVKDFVS